MIQTSALWKEIAAETEHTIQWQAVIAGVVYEDSELFDVNIESPMFDKFSVGNVCSAQLTLGLIPKDVIPKMAKIAMNMRIKYHEKVSEWRQRGVFYIDERALDAFGGLRLTAYDSALLAEQDFFGPEPDTTGWPAKPRDVMNVIMEKLGTSLDEKTVLMDESIVKVTDLTISCRSMASDIAKAHAGNWIVLPSGKWLLWTFDMAPPESFFLVDKGGASILFGSVRLIV